MKTLRLLSLLFSSLFFITACKKHNNHPTDKNGLPAATQTGAHTLGFLLNGEPWVPAGNNGSPRLTDDYDPLYNKGVMSITAYRIFSETDQEFFNFGVTDSMNFVKTPKIYTLSHSSLFNVYYSSVIKKVELYSTDDTTYCSGSMTLTKFDLTNHIISGTFTITMASPHTDTIRITDGRFDVLF